jgi:hypothetical protein
MLKIAIMLGNDIGLEVVPEAANVMMCRTGLDRTTPV